MADWPGLWWQWMNGFPVNKNPATDGTGDLCSCRQYNPHVWFLAGTFGGYATRTCVIPYGKSLLFPVITSIFSLAGDPNLKSKDDLIGAARLEIDKVTEVNLTIDDSSYFGSSQFRVKGQPFEYIQDGKQTIAVSDGYWVFLKPLNIGNHLIHFVGKNFDFYNEVNYNLSIISIC